MTDQEIAAQIYAAADEFNRIIEKAFALGFETEITQYPILSETDDISGDTVLVNVRKALPRDKLKRL